MKYASKTPDWIGAPVGTQRSGSDGERTSSEMSELSPQGGSKGYGTCEDDWNPLFVEALQKQDYVDYLLDTLLSPDMEERAALIASYGKEVRTIERRMAELEAGTAAGRDGRHTRTVSYTHLDVYKRQSHKRLNNCDCSIAITKLNVLSVSLIIKNKAVFLSPNVSSSNSS